MRCYIVVLDLVLLLVLAKQKHPGYKKGRGQSKAALQIDVIKNFDIS